MIAIIAAYDKNRLIGAGGGMPWHIPGELKRFRRLTENNIVIMGRKTYLAIGKPLPGRINIVLSRSEVFDGENCHTATSLADGLRLAKANWPHKDIYIGGGSDLYRQTVDMADVMYITEIDRVFSGDTYFPDFDENKFTKETGRTISGEVPYTYVTYKRKR